MITRAMVLALFVAVLCAGLGTTVPDVVDQPLEPRGSGAFEPIPIPATGGANGELLVREMQLRSADATALGAGDELRLIIGTYGTDPPLRQAVLTIGPGCVFRAHSRQLRDNASMPFVREPGCRVADRSAPVALTLTFQTDSPADARAALWASFTADASTPLLIVNAGERVAAVMGRRIVLRSADRTSRLRLLAFMWDLPPAGLWLLALGGAALVVAGGLLTAQAPPLRTGAGSFAIASGLAVCYAVTVPPLQAPDEPDHLLSYAVLSRRPEFAAATSVWARRIHFDRLAFAGDERFTPADRERPFDRDWPPAEVFAEDVTRRSSTTTRLWRAMAPLMPAKPPHALLVFRLADALILGAAIAAGTALLALSGGATMAGVVALVLMLIPTLPFFGMHVSELGFTLSAFILAGYAALLLCVKEPGRAAGTALGVVIALIAAGPRSGWPALAIIGGLCAARILTMLTRPSGENARTAWFWIGLVAPAAGLFATRLLWIPAPFYEQWHLAGFDPRGGISSAGFLLALSAGAIAGALAERVACHLAPVRGAAIVARAACALAAAIICTTLVWSLFAPLPILPTVESRPRASALEYVGAVLAPLVTAARVRDFDFLTWTSLWGGFGWANALLPARALAAVTIVVSIAAAATLLMFARDQDGRGAVVALGGAAGIAASIAVAAVSSFGLNRNVHGRYLLGGCIVGVCLLVAPSVMAGGRRLPAAVRSAALCAFVCALHGYALNFLLEKYFG